MKEENNLVVAAVIFLAVGLASVYTDAFNIYLQIAWIGLAIITVFEHVKRRNAGDG